MSNTHEALKRADAIGGWHAPAHPGIQACDEAAALLRTQHALIVQMAEAMEQCGRALEEVAMKGVEPTAAIDDGLISMLNTAFIAATQYLKGQK